MMDASEARRYERQATANAKPPGWRNPRPALLYDLLVIGAGPGGATAARDAAALGASVALVERDRVGGNCLNFGTIESKSLIRTARFYAEMRDAETLGAHVPKDRAPDFAAIMTRMRRIQMRLSKAHSALRLRDAGIDLFFGMAEFAGPDSVTVEGETLRFRKALIATGARAEIPLIPGLAENGYLTNETFFKLLDCPRRMLVIGGGPVGCEMAQAFSRFGAHVIIVQNSPTFLPKEERDAAQILSDVMAHDGVEIHLNTEVVAIRAEAGAKRVDLVSEDHKFDVLVDAVGVGVGRIANVDGLNLEAAGVAYDLVEGVGVDDFLCTSNPKVYAAGDVCLEHKFNHAAEATARIAVRNALFLGHRRLSDLIIPWCTYTDPEIAHVGLYVREAREQSIPVQTFTILMHDVDRAVIDGEDTGFVKIHVRAGSDEILGATVVARHAGEMINGLSLAITSRLGLRALARVVHTFPTQAEAIKMAAEAYERSRLTDRLKQVAARWLARRSTARSP
jgi:pyruvate/2-oxoglutarate dehydrogenase complex dihydrolipoamide dehydrogenase (E3) component